MTGSDALGKPMVASVLSFFPSSGKMQHSEKAFKRNRASRNWSTWCQSLEVATFGVYAVASHLPVFRDLELYVEIPKVLFF